MYQEKRHLTNDVPETLSPTSNGNVYESARQHCIVLLCEHEEVAVHVHVQTGSRSHQTKHVHRAGLVVHALYSMWNITLITLGYETLR